MENSVLIFVNFSTDFCSSFGRNIQSASKCIKVQSKSARRRFSPRRALSIELWIGFAYSFSTAMATSFWLLFRNAVISFASSGWALMRAKS